MAGSGFGVLVRLTTFGESHGKAVGGILEGIPAGFFISTDEIQKDLDRRRPGQSAIVSQRKESDRVQILSGIFEGKTLGTPIGFLIENEDQKSKDYDEMQHVFRPSHADFTYQQKYGIRDYRGGGRSSARETVSRVVAGSIARQVLETKGICIDAFVDQVGPLKWEGIWTRDLKTISESSIVRVPSEELALQIEELIREVRKDGDTIGGAVRCVISGVPAGLGEPVFDKLHAELGKAMLSINAVKGFEIGSGFGAASMKGSVHNDLFTTDGKTKTNHSGGIQGGISNGMPIVFRVAFKPVATLMQAQETISESFESTQLKAKGRHDSCVVPRAVPIVEAMAALVLLDYYLIQNAYCE
ncbi:chorismate synthase [Fluviicola sp.]|jgi:chorismate synthase|uniref:chorismate synthase n=1 Tax=Fluviicola sp. TaxID=1917219 RepID=UPI002823B049|nr:chorismate synthase [Fluviicola sp.]MDR0802929.1 chorismate synthase [Fluviicola sp.]